MLTLQYKKKPFHGVVTLLALQYIGRGIVPVRRLFFVPRDARKKTACAKLRGPALRSKAVVFEGSNWHSGKNARS